MKVDVTLTQEVTRRVQWEIDDEEFAQWREASPISNALLREFLESGRDFEEMVEAMWEQGKDITNAHDLIEIVRVQEIE